MKTFFPILALVLTSSLQGLSATTVANPTLTYVANGSAETVVVTVSDATSGSTVFYTLDGSYPTYTSPTVTAGGSITISEYSTLTLQAFKSGSTPSAIVTTQFSPASAVTSGGDHTLTLTSAGSLWGWGNNSYGVLGTGNAASSSWPLNSTLSGASPLLTLTTKIVPADSDGHGLPNYWQYTYFGTLGNSASALSSAGDSNTLLQEYQQNRSPIDFYQGTTPTLAIVSGNNQTGASGQFLTNTLVVKVTNSSGTPIANAPVQVVVAQGIGGVSTSNTGTPAPASSLQVIADSTGQATVFFRQPNLANFASTIIASDGSSSVTFTETTQVDTNPPAPPSNGTVAPGPTAGEIDLSWQNNADNATYIQIQQSTDNTNWTTVATLNDPTATFYAVKGLTIGKDYFFRIAAGN